MGDLEKLGQLPVQEILRGTDDCVMEFRNIFNIYVFKVRESFADISIVLLCSGDLENSKQLLVLKVFEVTHGNTSSFTEGCPGYSKSLKRSILVGIPAINSLTSKT